MKKLQDLQEKLNEAKLARERNKARYDAQLLIMEGARDTLRHLEEMNQHLMSEVTKSDIEVGAINKQLQEVVNT